MKTTLITGGSGGIGETFARKLAARGHNLFLVARSEDKLKGLCAELGEKHGIKAEYLAADLSETGSDVGVFERSNSLGLEIDWLINNAGFGSMGDFTDLELERELEMIRLNIGTLVALTHRFLPGMRARRRGTVINVSSSASFQPIPFMATYAATKAFVTSFSEALAEENRPFGVTVTALCPGPTETNFFEAAGMESSSISVKPPQTADEVVDTALAAADKGRTKVVPGWVNYAVATAGNFVPNSFIVRTISKKLRPKYQKG
ncbi:MAG: SDR family oxidoreductase [Blastocatellia bacterium]|nr:SDR family oxidoreductase [Blastocatellia bacterium]